ncbi:MAG: peptidoglycan editing factor PgeF [Myxococcaceae bacterium]
MKKMFLAKQVHGIKALRITSADSVEEIAKQEADALWTTEPNLCVGVKTADCAPVLLKHKTNACVAAIHAGWRGAVAGIVPKTLVDICETLNLKPADFKAQIGACIGFDSYEVGPEVAAQVSRDFVKPGKGDRFYLDLRNLIAQQLRQAGVLDIIISQACTFSEPEHYFSARRGDLGRQYSWIVL